MNNKYELIYEGKAKKIFTHDDVDKVKIEFKDDATAFNALKKEKFEGKGKLNCLISARIFEILINNDIPTHFIKLENENTMIAKKIKVIPLEIVLRNTAYGSLCKQTTIKSGTFLSKPLIDIYLKNDELNDPLITKDRIELMNILSSDDLESIINLTLKVNEILKSFFENIQLKLVDFKLEYGYDFKNNILLGDEISPDNCRLWDLNQKNDTIVSLDKDRFRNDLGGLIEAYSEIHRRINNFFNLIE
uniref:Phosphoribosylaminoimidazole-succinocarboxamide synthase n=1 Tax=uncultured Prochlorococcus marinus clone HF10-88H9 TaxID=379381 RepID=Q1PJU5_PROMR|nr:SAIcar synthetase [uncultured Prochlorococcus marinus clone HF10-88H9]